MFLNSRAGAVVGARILILKCNWTKILEEKLVKVYQTPAVAQDVSHKALKAGRVQWETSLRSSPVLILLPAPMLLAIGTKRD